jgi:hypothetical protein
VYYAGPTRNLEAETFGERVMHGIMGIVYGAALAYLVPVLRVWWSKPTSLEEGEEEPPPCRSIRGRGTT